MLADECGRAEFCFVSYNLFFNKNKRTCLLKMVNQCGKQLYLIKTFLLIRLITVFSLTHHIQILKKVDS